jgi:nitroreductase/NAD-dependent dihydropyrimidine dehydrogenase PreA subunit
METHPVFYGKKCTRCGLCVKVCPRGILSVGGDGVVCSGECLMCGHCYAVCRFDAVGFSSLRKSAFSSFPYREKYIPPGGITPSSVVNLMRSRRSVRHYTKKAPSRAMIADILEAAVSAPSGHNSQGWRFTVLLDPEKIKTLLDGMLRFYGRLNAMVRNPLVRAVVNVFLGGQAERYYQGNFTGVNRKIGEMEKGNDLFLYGAPAVIIIHDGADGNTPVEDAALAAGNISLLAHAMGLGTCINGYAVAAINRTRSLRKDLGIPDNHRVRVVLTVGYPAVKFSRAGLRKEYGVTWAERTKP